MAEKNDFGRPDPEYWFNRHGLPSERDKLEIEAKVVKIAGQLAEEPDMLHVLWEMVKYKGRVVKETQTSLGEDDSSGIVSRFSSVYVLQVVYGLTMVRGISMLGEYLDEASSKQLWEWFVPKGMGTWEEHSRGESLYDLLGKVAERVETEAAEIRNPVEKVGYLKEPRLTGQDYQALARKFLDLAGDEPSGVLFSDDAIVLGMMFTKRFYVEDILKSRVPVVLEKGVRPAEKRRKGERDGLFLRLMSEFVSQTFEGLRDVEDERHESAREFIELFLSEETELSEVVDKGLFAARLIAEMGDGRICPVCWSRDLHENTVETDDPWYADLSAGVEKILDEEVGGWLFFRAEEVAAELGSVGERQVEVGEVVKAYRKLKQLVGDEKFAVRLEGNDLNEFDKDLMVSWDVVELREIDEGELVMSLSQKVTVKDLDLTKRTWIGARIDKEEVKILFEVVDRENVDEVMTQKVLRMLRDVMDVIRDSEERGRENAEVEVKPKKPTSFFSNAVKGPSQTPPSSKKRHKQIGGKSGVDDESIKNMEMGDQLEQERTRVPLVMGEESWESVPREFRDRLEKTVSRFNKGLGRSGLMTSHFRGPNGGRIMTVRVGRELRALFEFGESGEFLELVHRRDLDRELLKYSS